MDEKNRMLEKIDQLEKENEELRKWQGSVNQLLGKMLDMVTHLEDSKTDKQELEAELDDLWTYARINRYRINSLPYELQDPDYESFFYKPHILTKEETIRQIVDEGKSL